MKHVLIALAAMTVLLLPEALRALRRRRAMARRPWPDAPVEEHLSSSGRLKAVVFAYDNKVMRVEVFQRVADDAPPETSWRRIAGPSFVDKGAVPDAVREALRAAGAD